MSCQIKLFANINDTAGVRRYLFPWDDDRGSENWLNSCNVSISPTGELIAITNNNRIIVLSAKWDSNAVLNQYHILPSGTELSEATDPITALLCLPIASQSQNSQVGPDWICIVVGFQSGEVKFYTENCMLLLTEQFHDEQVVNIKCQSQHCTQIEVGSDFHPEELYIQYQKCVCVLSGSHLFTTLRNFRSQLAKVQANGDNMSPSSHLLLHKKWGLYDQYELSDTAVVGLDISNTFNHLLTASTCGGFDTRYRAMPPNNTLIIGAGTKPYIGFHYAVEGGSQPLLSDVAKAVASKLKSALPGWLVGNKSNVEKSPPPAVVQPTEPISCRFGLCDLRRTADSIILSPNKKLSIITDSLGRVALVDNNRGVIVRLWKGYRDAQCAFLQVTDEERTRGVQKTRRRIALFMIVYTPKKGTIEIWALQQGPKIVTFSASKYSKLIYTNYGLMGVGANTTKNKHNNCVNCYLLDPDGQIKEIIVPFHFALTEKNSKRARDIHLLKRLKHLIKSDDSNLEKLCTEIQNTCSELKTNEVLSQCFDLITGSKFIQPNAVSLMADCFLDKLLAQEDHDQQINKLLTLNRNVKLIVDFYTFIEGDVDAENGNVISKEEQNIINTRFVIGDKEMNNLQRLLDLSTLNDLKKNSELKVTFQEENKRIFSEYLSVFDLTSNEDCILLKSDIAEDKLFRVSEQVFKTFILFRRNDTELFKDQILSSKIRTLDLIKMILNFWVNKPFDMNVNLEEEMQNFSRVLHSICLTTTNDSISAEYNKVSPFWTEIRDYLANSAKPFPALTAAILCRSVAQRIEQEKEAQQCSATSIEDETNADIWEKLSQENCQWTLLIGKLEDISLLNIILTNKPICQNCSLPKLFYERTIVSLKYILRKGKGSVSELIAQWLASGGIEPEYVIANEFENNESNNFNLNQPVFEHLNILRKQFPYSLEANSILTNMCWEYILTWQKNNENLSHLEVVNRCIQLIPNPFIKQGLYNLIWTTHVKQTFESVCKLINKVGKVPKEILCRQDTGLSDLQIAIFVEFCTNFLHGFLDSVKQCHNLNKTELHFENLWENGGKALTELALQQDLINDSLLHVHYQLSLIIQMISTFAIKQTKPVQTLFDSSTVVLFFTDLTQNNADAYSNDPKLTRIRIQFLTKVINASIETVTVNDETIYSLDHVNWMSKCVMIASIWGVDTDVLRRHQVVMLYTNGFNALAEELLASISNTEALGSELLTIAGKQLKKLLMSSEDLTEKIVALTPSLSQYLETLDRNWCASSPLDGIISLAEHVVRFLQEGNNYNRQATLLLDACLTLRGMEES